MPVLINGSGTFGIDINSGNLKVSDHSNTSTYFSTNLDNSLKSQQGRRTAKLHDTGNLVLTDDETGEILWESFNHPTDTFLPGMKMDDNLNLTSWINDEDPAPGNFSFRLDEEVGGGYVIIKLGAKPYWKSGRESVDSFIQNQISIPAARLLSGDTKNINEPVNNTRLLLQSNGEIQYLGWNSVQARWLILWSEPKGPCSVYDACGSFGSCKPDTHNLCTCLPGFKPSNEDDWKSDNIQEGSTAGDHVLFYRVDFPSRLVGSPQRNRKSSPLKGVIISASVIIAVALLCIISCISFRRFVAKRKDGNIEENPVLQFSGNEFLMDQNNQFREDDKKDLDVPFFELESIVAATDNFSQAYKLGQGGFGPVYKGMFPGGEEIAVKRLSSNSGQGLTEFKNEVLLIAKLQHRNLVRLLGYCMKGNEKILLYEYMPNKSLDAFIFGVARGLLYLHQDSRLRIIHRDMKASNILLDKEMNPKISDFGLARIVGGRETESNTNRVIGTYGYMAPEYALEGQFSVKSDAFSFGVVILEIISGKKNSAFFDDQLALSVLGYAWSLWKEEKAMTLLDETLVGSCDESEVLKCIIIGLLCVQEDPNDRPNMSKVVFMLSSETQTLPNPNRPAFVTRNRFSGTTSSSSTKPESRSENEITLSEVDCR
ncbi:hypothetical protein AgCh_038040 [Apium graveolens]